MEDAGSKLEVLWGVATSPPLREAGSGTVNSTS